MNDERGSREYYSSWDKYVQEETTEVANGPLANAEAGRGSIDNRAEADEEDDNAAEESERKIGSTATMSSNLQQGSASAKGGGFGYEFRPGHKTDFPTVETNAGETEEAAAYRVAALQRVEGVDVFNDGTVWGAQQAVDIWGQGLLAMERAKNLRKYRKARIEGGTATQQDLDVQALEDADDAAALVDEHSGPTEQRRPSTRRVPSEAQLLDLQLTLRLNIAQALLKLREYEKCIQYCDLALEIDPASTKALWRKAKAVWGVRNPGLARETLERLLKVDSGNAAALAMLKEIDEEEAKKQARRLGARPRGKAVAGVGLREQTGNAAPVAPVPQASAATKLPSESPGFDDSLARRSWCSCCSRRLKAA